MKAVKQVTAILLTVSVAFGLVSCDQASPPPLSDDAKFEAVRDKYWQSELEAEPALATILGVHEYDDRLNDLSLAAFDKRNDEIKGFVQDLAALDPDALTDKNRLDHQVLRYLLEMRLERAGANIHLMPISTIQGWHLFLPRLRNSMPFRTVAHYDNYLSRLSGIGQVVDQGIAVLHEGVAQGFVQPCESIKGVESSFLAYVSDDAEGNVMYGPFEKMPDTMAAEDQARLTARAVDIIEGTVVPAFQKMHDYWMDEYVPHCRELPGLHSVSGGSASYETLVRYYTTTNMTADQVHQTGLDEVARITAEMEVVKDKIGFDGDLPAFFTHLRTSKDYYLDDPEEYLAKTALVAKRFDEQMPKLFGALPRTPFTIKPYPAAIAHKMPAGQAEPVAPSAAAASVFRINLSRIETRPTYNIVPLTLHEAFPGHLLQVALAMEQDIPAFRRYVPLTAYIEGWGLYAEWLGVEAGMYDDPLDDFGRLIFEMWRACRLVVDTGIHAKGWSRDQAINFMVDHTALSHNNIVAEVDRYITLPGQATSYKIGQMKLMELRKRAETALGPDFDVRKFHDVILTNGSLPLTVLEAQVDRWIAQELQS